MVLVLCFAWHSFLSFDYSFKLQRSKLTRTLLPVPGRRSPHNYQHASNVNDPWLPRGSGAMISGQTMPDLKPLELVGCFFPQAKDY